MHLSQRPLLLVVALVAIVGAIVAIERPWEGPKSTVPPPPDNLPPELAHLDGAPDFGGATNWIGSESLDLVALRGKVVMVDFWTYSCINCIRTLPHLTGLYDTYEDHGFVLVGVHTPEFRFERDPDNVRRAMDDHGIRYPVAQDNNFDIWDAYHNRFWPTHYLIDQYGKIRDRHIGEGAYVSTEEKVRALLREAGYTDLPTPFEEKTDPGPRGDDVTPERFAGTGRSALGNSEGYQPGKTVQHAWVDEPRRDRIYLSGNWSHGDESVTATTPGTVQLLFRAGGSNFVADATAPTCVPVTLDGAPITREHAPADVHFGDGAPCIPIDGPDSYDYYQGPVDEHHLVLHVPAGFTLYSFAFYHYGST